MDSGSVEQPNEEIIGLLKDNNVTTIVLVGKSGVGKTWMAREITKYAINKGLAYETLWVSLNNKYDETTFHESIACQFSLLYPTEECEDDDGGTEEESLKQLIPLKLQGKVSTMLEEKGSTRDEGRRYLLLILDDVPTKVNEKNVMVKLKRLLCPNQNFFLKVVITRRDSDGSLINEGTNEDIEVDNTRLHRIEPLSEQMSLSLLQDRVKTAVSAFPGFDALSRDIIKRSMGLPAAIIMIADALNYIGQHDSGVWTLGSFLKEAASEEEVANNVTWLLSHWYETLPSSIMTNCCWHSRQFFSKHGGVHYNELITYWILEGYFGHTDQIETAYEEGHRVLMELINRGMLKKHEDNIVVMEEVTLDMTDHRRSGFGGTASLGLANVFEDDEWEGLGRITQTVGMIKTLFSGKRRQELSTLLIDGSRLCREVPAMYFQDMQGLQVLALFNPRLNSLPLSLSSMEKLRVLVIRGCDHLEKIDDFLKHKTLTALEISGASSLEKIPDNLFEQMLHLRSLNLSAAQIKFLPPLSKLSELRWLILRGCSHLETLPSLETLKNLEVLDLSGATSLKRIPKRDLQSLQKLQMLDLSKTKIDSLPFFKNFGVLTRLLLNGCSHLKKLPHLTPLNSLQVLDLSGASDIKEIRGEASENKGTLKILNLSKTSISELPSNIFNLSNLESLDLSDASRLEKIEEKSFECLRYLRHLNLSNTIVKKLPSLSNLGNLCQLLLRGCSCLEILPEIKGLTRLEVLDLSGCSALTAIPNESFEHMSHLQMLNLSETKIQYLPPFCNSRNLAHLLLRNCEKLQKLPPLDSLSKLQELDICGASSLSEIKAELVEHMNLLQILNLSGSKLEVLPSMSNLINLSQLKLSGCSLLEALQPLDTLTNLEVLDLSGTGVGSLTFLEKLSNLRELLLRDCKSLEELSPLESLVHLEVLDLSGTRIKEFPYVISELTRLKRLYLPDLKGIQKVDWGKIKRLPEEVNWDQCGIFKTDEILVDNRPSLQVRGTEFFQLLRTPELRDSCLKQFYFSVCPLRDQCKDGDIYCHRDEFDFRDIFSLTRHFSYPKGHGCSLEICGFDSFPTGVEVVLKHVEYLSLIENKFISCLSDIGADNSDVIKGCWLERCTEMKRIFHEEKRDVGLGENLEILWASNLPNLERVCSGNLQSGSFKTLKHLYLNCCPKLVKVFPSSLLPENLEILHIKFCDKLETVFECNASSECKLQKLQKLQLLELPELKSIGVVLLPSVIVDVRECPKLENLEEILKLGNASAEISRNEYH